MQNITGNELAREILKGDRHEIKERLIALRRDKNMSDQDFFQAFALVTLNLLNRSQIEQVNATAQNAKIHDDPLAVVEACLKQNDCGYERHERSIQTSYQGENCHIRIFVIKPRNATSIVFVVPEILKVTKKAEQELVNAICQMNLRIVTGSFCYDYTDSSLSFRIALMLGKGEMPSDDQVGGCLANCCLVVDKYFPEFAKVCWG
jgi:hypothetical protein